MNKYQEILERILKNTKCYGKLDYDFGFIQKLIRKATPTIPSYEGDGYSDGEIVFDTWICPYCGEYYEIEETYDYCPKCGQCIDWEMWKGKNDEE